MKTFTMIVFFLICNISTMIIAVLTPYITRKTVSFGVTIPEDVHSYPEIKNIEKNYRKKVLTACGLIFLAVLTAILIKASDVIFLLIPASMILNIFVMYVFYIDSHKKMEELKEKENWAAGRTQTVVIDTGFRNRKLTLSPLWFALYAIVIIVTAAIGIVLYDKIPARIPMHWNIDGVADKWVNKSYRTIMWAPLAQIFLTFTMMFSYWSIAKSKQVINPANPEVSSEQNRLFKYRWTSFIIFTGLALLIMFLFIEFFSFGFLKNTWFMIAAIVLFPLGILIASIVLSIKTGQGGSRIKIKGGKEDNSANKVISRDVDKYWKLGLIYYNPDDPSIFVEKRFGVGMTINFGRPRAWMVLIGFIIFLAAFSIAITIFTR